ncbi:Hypothetical_protein [Hexamita inflata]|uniref:Hypothetical_protein n=1 Tax=Hexamita inflata TaxID=28002 RepID=A0AA86TKC6_9EUKA|nr:Hypothetical protein HINF_LOCUS7486 [Hexamita inflata]
MLIYIPKCRTPKCIRKGLLLINVYNKPTAARILTVLSLGFLAGGCALIAFSVSSNNSGLAFGIAGTLCLVVGGLFIIFSIESCSQVKSFAYIVTPCCVSESECQRLKEYAEIRSLQKEENQVLIPQEAQQVNQQLNDYQNGQQTVAHNQYNVVSLLCDIDLIILSILIKYFKCILQYFIGQ